MDDTVQENQLNDKQTTWLRNIKYHYPQLKQEWSEEDSVRLQRIIDFLWYNRKGDTDTIYQQEQDIEWLKSLRPQNTWKPSDEQMVQLGKYCPDNRPLTLLYEQLKKLTDN
jgi:hypothetical protein